MSRTRGLTLLGVGSLLLALFLTYANSLDNGFHYDDSHSLVDNRHIRSLASIPQFFTEPGTFSTLAQRAMFRPLVLVSYAINYYLGQYEPRGYRLCNLAVHAICVCLVVALARALGLSSLWSSLAGLVFAFHPVQAETVNYISSRSESLAAMGYLTGLVAFIRCRACNTSREGKWLYALSVTAFVIGLLAKSTAATLPAALLICDWRRSRGRAGIAAPGWRAWLRPHVPFWAIVVLYVVIVRELAATALGSPVRSLDSQLFTQAKALVYYASMVAMPVKLSIDHQFSASHAMTSVAVVLALALTGTVVAFFLRGRDRGVTEALQLPAMWAGLALLPTIVVPLNVLVNEHRLYLPLAFGAIAVAGLVGGTRAVAGGAHGHAIQAVLGVCVLCLALMSHSRSYAWKDAFTIWSDAQRKGPAMYRPYQELGGAHEARSEFDAALGRYETASRLAPRTPEVHYNRANALRQLGRMPEAEAAYRMSLEVSSGTFVPALINLSHLVRAAGRLAEATALMEQARALAPANAEVWGGLGVLYRQHGQVAAAREAHARALELDPASATTHYNLGNLLRDEAEHEAAARHYESALALDAGMHDARFNLAVLLVRMGRHRQAGELSMDGLRRWPEFTKLHYALARAQEGLGRSAAALSSYRRFLPHAPSAAMRDWVRARIDHLQRDERPSEGVE